MIFIKKFLKISVAIFVALLTLQVAGFIILQFPAVQTAIAGKVVHSVSGHINGKISVGKVYIAFFNKVLVNDISIVSTEKSPLLDSLKANYGQSDTLLSCRKLSVSLNPKELLKLNFKLDRVSINGGVFNLQTEQDRYTNLDRIFRLSKDTPKDTSRKGSLNLLANSLRIENFRFNMNNPAKSVSKGDSIINFSNLRVHDININISDVHLREDTLFACINNISAADSSGFAIRTLRGNARVCGKEAIISDLFLQDNYTTVDAGYYYMKYDSPKDFSEFTQKVRLGANFKNTYLNFNTIGRIAPSLYKSNLAFYINGEVSGTVSNLRTDKLVVISESGLSYLDFKARIMGLPDIRSTMAVAEIKNSSTTFGDIASIVASINNTPRNRFLAKLSPFVSYRFKGNLLGMLDDFVIDGKIRSSVGVVDLDLLFRNETDYGVRFDGKLASSEVNLGVILGNKLFGNVTLDADLDALFKKGGKGMDVSIDSIVVHKFGLNGYDYSNLRAAGNYTGENFNGSIICHDPNLHFMFQGLFSFGKDSRSRYDFSAYVPFADLSALNIDKRFPTSQLSFSTTANFTNEGSNYLLGNITLKNVSYRNPKGNFNFGKIKLQSLQSNNMYTATLDAPFANVEYSGPAPVNLFVKKFADLAFLSKIDNFIERDSTIKYNSGNYRFTATTSNTMDICNALYPGLYIMDNTKLNVYIDRKDNFTFKAQSGRVALNANFLKDFELNVTGGGDKGTVADLFSKNIRVAGVKMDSSTIKINADTNVVMAGFNFRNDSTGTNYANLESKLVFKPGKVVDINILDGSQINLEGEKWSFNPSLVTFADSSVIFDNFGISNNLQKFAMEGNISKNSPDSLDFSLRDFNIGVFNLFMSKSFNLEGYFSGSGQISDLYRAPKVFFDITGDSVYVFNNPVGTLKMLSKWDDSGKQLNLLVKSKLDNRPHFTALGWYKPDEGHLNMKASLEDLSVCYFEPFLSDLISKSKGTLSGELELDGTFDKLSLTGQDCRFRDFGFTVNFTQVPYIVNGPVELDEKGISFNNLPIRDNYSGKGTVNGKLSYNYFRDLAIDTKVDFTNMQCLKTTEKDNDAFYGDAFATGSIHIKGPLDRIGMDINVVSNAKTAIHVPLSSSANASQTNLLTFVEPEVWIDPYDTLAINRSGAVKTPTQLDVHLKANLTPQADIMIEINKSVGDVIKANGNGLITMDINPSKDVFDIFGDYNINTGSYKFVLAGFAAKDFTLQPGGNINFNGDIYNTNLNLEAVYHTKASINTLIADTSSVSTRRNVDCIISMQGKLTNPELSFDINIPDLDPTTKIRVESALNTQGKIQKQLMALLVSGGFIPDEQSGIANNSSILYSNASEILSNQINMIFQQLGIPLDLGLNYQPGERGTDIFDVAVSTQLFNNRVVINGNIGNDPYGNNNRNVIGNIDVEIKLNNTGNVRLDLFSHAEDQYSTYNDNNSSQRSGVGIVYQKEFNSFKSLFRGKSKAQKAYEKQEREKKKQEKINSKNIVRE